MEKDGKTEKPTPKRLRDSRKKGEVGKSQDLPIALSVFGFAFLLSPFVLYLFKHFIPYLKGYLQNLGNYQASFTALPRLLIHSILLFFLLGVPFFLLAMSLGFITNIVQVGFLVSPKALKPSFKRLNPVNNIKQMIGPQAFMNTLKTIAKLLVVVIFCYQEFMKSLAELINTSTFGIQKLILFFLEIAHRLFLKVAILLVILGIFDYMFQKYQHQKRLKMSKQEIKEEYKQMEGDPKIKSQRRAQYQAMVRNSISQVKQATVVITNPTHFAIAIRYDEAKDAVPVVLAKGVDSIAQRMKQEAEKQEVPMIENRTVARALYAQVEPGQAIPLEFYESLAEIIVLVYQLEKKAKKNR